MKLSEKLQQLVDDVEDMENENMQLDEKVDELEAKISDLQSELDASESGERG